jgi:hypothetical protein
MQWTSTDDAQAVRAPFRPAHPGARATPVPHQLCESHCIDWNQHCVQQEDGLQSSDEGVCDEKDVARERHEPQPQHVLEHEGGEHRKGSHISQKSGGDVHRWARLLQQARALRNAQFVVETGKFIGLLAGKAERMPTVS